MKQYEIEGNTLTLRVKKGPIIIRSVLFLIAFLFFVAPLISIAVAASNKSGLKLGHILGPILFGLMGFYLLRLALWNTYGKEIITFDNSSLNYIADYGWFKDGRKHKPLDDEIEFTIQKVGYEEDYKGKLLINFSKDQLQCVTVMSVYELEMLIGEVGVLAG